MAYSLKKFTSKTTERERHKKKHFTDRTNLKHHNQKNIIFSACFASNLCGSNRCKYIMYISERFNFTWKLENHNFPDLQQRSYCFCRLQAAMLSSAEFICLRVAYRAAFWKEFSRLIWMTRSIQRLLLFSVHVPYMLYFSTAYRRELVVVFKVNCFPFLNCFASFLLDIIFLPALPSITVYSLLLHLDPCEKISSLRRYKTCFAHTSH